LIQQRGPTSSRMLETEHGSAEAEESTRQTFPVYGSFGLPVNRHGAETTRFCCYFRLLSLPFHEKLFEFPSVSLINVKQHRFLFILSAEAQVSHPTPGLLSLTDEKHQFP
jgi:hypothetical protein